MITVRKRSGETIILGTEQEQLLQAVIQFAIDEGEQQSAFKFAGTLDRIKRLEELFRD